MKTPIGRTMFIAPHVRQCLLRFISSSVSCSVDFRSLQTEREVSLATYNSLEENSSSHSLSDSTTKAHSLMSAVSDIIHRWRDPVWWEFFNFRVAHPAVKFGGFTVWAQSESRATLFEREPTVQRNPGWTTAVSTGLRWGPHPIGVYSCFSAITFSCQLRVSFYSFQLFYYICGIGKTLKVCWWASTIDFISAFVEYRSITSVKFLLVFDYETMNGWGAIFKTLPTFMKQSPLEISRVDNWRRKSSNLSRHRVLLNCDASFFEINVYLVEGTKSSHIQFIFRKSFWKINFSGKKSVPLSDRHACEASNGEHSLNRSDFPSAEGRSFLAHRDILTFMTSWHKHQHQDRRRALKTVGDRSAIWRKRIDFLAPWHIDCGASRQTVQGVLSVV